MDSDDEEDSDEDDDDDDEYVFFNIDFSVHNCSINITSECFLALFAAMKRMTAMRMTNHRRKSSKK